MFFGGPSGHGLASQSYSQSLALPGLDGPSLTADERVFIRSVSTVVLPVTQLVGLHTSLVLTVVLPQGAAGLRSWGGKELTSTMAPGFGMEVSWGG